MAIFIKKKQYAKYLRTSSTLDKWSWLIATSKVVSSSRMGIKYVVSLIYGINDDDN